MSDAGAEKEPGNKSQSDKSPRQATGAGGPGCVFVLVALVWIALMMWMLFSRATFNGPGDARAECRSLGESVHVVGSPNVASSKGSDDGGFDLEDLERSCEAQRLNDAMKLILVGTIGATTLTYWVVVATRRPELA